MTHLQELYQQLTRIRKAPVEQWNPSYCGALDLVIDGQGHWYHEGAQIQRPALIQLFARLLKKEDADYYLVTPVEKISIQVIDFPFIITRWWYEPTSIGSLLVVETNIGERYIIDEQHPIEQINDTFVVRIRDGMHAKIHRNVFYQWANEMVYLKDAQQGAGYYLPSGEAYFFIDTAET